MGFVWVFVSLLINGPRGRQLRLLKKSGIVCVSMSLGSKVMEIINFRNSRMTKSKMAAK